MNTPELNKLVESFHPLENKLLLSFSRSESLAATEIIALSGLDDSRLDMATGWLASTGLLSVTGDVFCENDSMCLGAQKAIADAGRGDEMFLCGVDGEKAALVAILAEGSNYACTALNNSDQIGRAAFHRIMAILAGSQTPKDTVLPSPLITKDNAPRYYNPDSVI